MMRKVGGLLVVFFLLSVIMMTMSAFAESDPNNGDWELEEVVLRHTSEAELMVRVGSINNVGFGF